ncbi:MAG: hypothetical protein B6I18_04590 [Bacteroidetes bacterium 4572_112]|nr:MAG: hypothetical protein B6I18_04590 [Bacteroidetes bacterium 4572_112]
MTNNDILRRLRYTFDITDSQMIKIFADAGKEVDRSDISNWMKKEEDPAYKNLVDKSLSYFLNGFIINRRGKKEGPLPNAESKLNNNIILRKLKIALNLKDDDVLELLSYADFRLSKHELSAFFRKPTQSQFRKCKDQVIRNFLHGVQIGFKKEE